MVTFENFYLGTFANFYPCKVPNRRQDFTSYNKEGKVSSRYWYGVDSKGGYVIRLSDHWGIVASCKWLLKGSTENYKSPKSGKVYFSEIK